MAETLIYVFLEPVWNKIASSAVQEFQSLWDVEKEVEKLSKVLSTLKSVLRDANKKQFHSNEVSDWLRRLKDAAYNAEDVLDEFVTEALRPEIEREIQTSKRNKAHRMCFSCFTSNPVLFRHEMAHKIDELLRRLQGIAEERKHLDLHETEGEFSQHQIREGRNTVSFIHESDVVGREIEKERLINLLSSDCSVAREKDLSVISIVGMGGVGKTTLAQLVYNDERVEKHFDVKGWVCVSENFDSERVSKAIIESTSGKPSNYVELNSFAVEIKKIVTEKKFLLVLDDVWNDKYPDQWKNLIIPLRCGANGSKIILTTRSENVSKDLGTIYHYRLGILSNDECWLLLRKYAFPYGGWDEDQDLVVIGKKIAEKCKGLPLAAKTLGGLLEGTREKKEWKEILDNEIWETSYEGKDPILAPLRLSYHHLPSHLKQCFLYCSIFPKDHEFDKETLVKLWMAEGFITFVGQREIEDVGCRYFDELLWRSLFQCEKNQFGELVYKMHDMIHDLAQSVSKDECFRMDGDRLSDFSEKIRYLSSISHRQIDPEIFMKVLQCKGLHTLLGIRIGIEGIPSSNNLFQRLKFLHVLDLHVEFEIKELPDSIGNLKQLRYLALSSLIIIDIKDFILPESTSSLYNLQTLDLCHCLRLVKLPEDTQNLIKLRHLFPPVNLSVMPKGIGRLKCLRTLSDFIVGKEPGRDIGQLIGLINLRGGLRISQLQNAVNPKEDVLKDKEFIEKLDLSWDYGTAYDGEESAAEEILERLQPHPANLRELNIWGYVGERFSSWIGNPSFSKLVDVQLWGCDSCVTLPPLWQLPSLKRLVLRKMAKVTRLFYADGIKPSFPSLEELQIESIPNLVEWSGGTEKEGDFPCLRELNLSRCNGRILSSVSYFTSLSSLNIDRIENLKAIPSGFFKYLKALEKLDISDCKELVSLVQKDDDDEEDSCKHLHSLESLWIFNCPLLEVLPDGLKNLISLKRLTINHCGALATLPEEGLPPTLQFLSINGCSLLAQRCKEECGEDWPKISHIPTRWIDDDI